MAKKANTEVKKAKAMKIDMSFGEWVRTVARKRGDVGGEFIAKAKEDKKFPDYKELPKFAKKFGDDVGFQAAMKRYNAFLARGSQSKAA